MTSTYTLHLPRDARPGDARELERARLVRDGFSAWAALAPALWLFSHRHWILGLVAAFGPPALAFGLGLAGLPPGRIFLVLALLQVLFGFEASSLRRWAYERRGWPAVGLVSARDRREAESKAFTDWLDRPEMGPRPAPRTSARPSPWRRPGDHDVIGMFPDPELRR
jgi:hypothetical protein